MYTNGIFTHFEKKSKYKKTLYEAYIENSSSSSYSKAGKVKNYSLFLAVPTTKELPFSEGDLIVVGNCSLNIDTSSEKAESTTYKELNSKYKVYSIKSVEPCLIGSKRMWHYELGCD